MSTPDPSVARSAAPRHAVRRALLSVSDKTGIVELAAALIARGIALLSTGGTAKTLRASGIEVTDVSEVTGFPEIMHGRVKTLHPRIHGGLLGRDGVDDAAMAEHGIAAIDLLVVNLYPFEATIAKSDCTYEDAVENIDIGGPAMLRAAAKNHARVAVIVDPTDYAGLIDALTQGGTTQAQRRDFAAKAYAHTAHYDGTSPSGCRHEQLTHHSQRCGRAHSICRYVLPPRCVTVRTRISAVRCIWRTMPRQPALRLGSGQASSPPQHSCKARNSPTTTLPTPTLRSNASRRSTRRPA